jgi:acid phosphatase type 7
MTRAPSHPRHHKFGQQRPPMQNGHSQASPLYHGSKEQPLPAPTGTAPFRLDLAEVIPDAVAAMTKAGGMAMHMVGDTGGVQDPTPQQLVANGLEQDAGVAGSFGTPAFFYHLGDVIYFDGQADQYFPQFYQPYEHYPNPIIAIPGNHDGDVYDDGKRTNPEPSLASFVRNFCASEPGVHTPEAREATRTAMVQPNVYFTLKTPFATFVGLYTNVPEGGVVHQNQQEWFAGELAAADKDMPLIVAMHHPIQSLDTFHSGSKTMAKVLETAVAKAKRQPAMVFAGHVHNYQRFSVNDHHGMTPFVVAGHGGYHNLHKVVKSDNQDLVTPYSAPNDPNVVLESYMDDRFGFLRLEFSGDIIDLRCMSVPRPQESWSKAPRLYDRVRYDWRKRAAVAS